MLSQRIWWEVSVAILIQHVSLVCILSICPWLNNLLFRGEAGSAENGCGRFGSLDHNSPQHHTQHSVVLSENKRPDVESSFVSEMICCPF